MQTNAYTGFRTATYHKTLALRTTHATSFWRQQRCYNVETTSCAYWEMGNYIYGDRNLNV